METLTETVETVETKIHDTADRNIKAGGAMLMKHVPGTIYSDSREILTEVNMFDIVDPSPTYFPVPHVEVFDQLLFNIERAFGKEAIEETHLVLSCKGEGLEQVIGARMFGMIVTNVKSGS